MFVALVAYWFGIGLESDLVFVVMIAAVIGSAISEALYTASLTLVSGRQDRPARSVLLRSALWVALVVALFFTGVAMSLYTSDGLLWAIAATAIITQGVAGAICARLVQARRYALAVFRGPIGSAMALLLALVWVAREPSATRVALSIAAGYGFSLGVLLVIDRPEQSSETSLPLGATDFLGRTASAFAGVAVATSAIVVVERLIASQLATGSVSGIAFARGLAMAPMLVIWAIAAGTFPEAVRRAELGDLEGLASVTVAGIRRALIVSVILAVVLLGADGSIVELTLGRGRFDAKDAQQTAELLALFAPGVIGVGVFSVGVRFLYAAGHRRLTAFLGMSYIGLYVALALLGATVWGASGLVGASSIASLVIGGFTGIVVVRRFDVRRSTVTRNWIFEPALLAGSFCLGFGLVFTIGNQRGGDETLTTLVLATIVGAASFTTAASALGTQEWIELRLAARSLRRSG